MKKLLLASAAVAVAMAAPARVVVGRVVNSSRPRPDTNNHPRT
jgi:hypothetical protein